MSKLNHTITPILVADLPILARFMFKSNLQQPINQFLFLNLVPSAHGFYGKLGFIDTVHSDIDLSEWGPKYGRFGMYRLQGMLTR